MTLWVPDDPVRVPAQGFSFHLAASFLALAPGDLSQNGDTPLRSKSGVEYTSQCCKKHDEKTTAKTERLKLAHSKQKNSNSQTTHTTRHAHEASASHASATVAARFSIGEQPGITGGGTFTLTAIAGSSLLALVRPPGGLLRGCRTVPELGVTLQGRHQEGQAVCTCSTRLSFCDCLGLVA